MKNTNSKHFLTSIGDEQKIKNELDDKFDINYSSSDGTTALMEAAAHGNSFAVFSSK